MKKNLHSFLKLFIVLLFFIALIGCQQQVTDDNNDNNDTEENGKITVNLINASAANGKNFIIVICSDEDDPAVDPHLDEGAVLIASGTASYTTATVFTGGLIYDVWVNVDLDDSYTGAPGTGAPNNGDRHNAPGIDVSINGNKTVTIDYNTLLIK